MELVDRSFDLGLPTIDNDLNPVGETKTNRLGLLKLLMRSICAGKLIRFYRQRGELQSSFGPEIWFTAFVKGLSLASTPAIALIMDDAGCGSIPRALIGLQFELYEVNWTTEPP